MYFRQVFIVVGKLTNKVYGGLKVKKSNCFKEFLEERFSDQFCKKIKWFFIDNRDLILDKLYRVKNIYNIEVENLEFLHVYTEEDKNGNLIIEVIIRPEISFETKSYKTNDCDVDSNCDIWLSVSCTGSLREKLNDFKIIGVNEYNKQKFQSYQLDGDLVPYIPKESYEKRAEEILHKYYPEALKNPIQIDVGKFAERLNLNVVKHRITKEGNIFGQIYFKTTNIELYDEEQDVYKTFSIPANTVLVDEKTAFLHSFGSYNMTVIHECLHSLLHRKAFQFAQIMNSELSLLQCKTKGGLVGVSDDSNAIYMEIQANGIAPYILMPRKPFFEKTKAVMDMYSQLYTDELDYIEKDIEDLANYFGVSIYAARKRMIEDGFDIAQGAFNWVDGHYVRPYAIKSDRCGKNESYTISFKEFIDQLYSMGELVLELFQGKFIFIENHVCINNEKYIIRNNQGCLELTSYARHHIDECCVKFQCIPTQEVAFSGDLASMCYLCRNISKDLTFELKLKSDPKILKDPNLQDMVDDYNRKILDIKKDISFMPLNDIIKYFLNYFEMDKGELAIDADLSDKTIDRYLKGTTKPEKNSVIAIIIAFKLPPQISFIVLNRANIVLNDIDKTDNTLRVVLLSLYGHSIEDVNGFLIGAGYDALKK